MLAAKTESGVAGYPELEGGKHATRAGQTARSYRIQRGVLLRLDEPTLGDLFQDQLQLFALGAEIAGMPPLELRLQRAARLPVGVAEMVVDDRIVSLQGDGALQLRYRLVVAAEAVIGPAETVDDVAVVGAKLDRLADHRQGL